MRGAMASNVAPPKNTAGGGFVFEDDVCAWLLACMLAGEPTFGPDLGNPVRLDFQTRPDGWLLDDVLVTTQLGATEHRIALSIKSNAQFTASSAPSDFVKNAWEQWLHSESTVFRRDKDFMGIVTAPLTAAAAASVSGLVTKARAADPETFLTRLETPHWASDDQGRLFDSFGCPEALATGDTRPSSETTRLLKRLHFREHDFGYATTESVTRSLELARKCVRSRSQEDGLGLWNLLRGIAAELRPDAGHITHMQLVERLRHHASLADHPDHTSDWAALDARCGRDASQVVNAIAGRVRLPRSESVSSLAAAVQTHELVALLGPSGVGKSAIARAFFVQRHDAQEQRTLWFDGRSLDCIDFGTFEATLRLQYSLGELLASTACAHPVLVLDGLDRLSSESAFRNVATLLRMAQPEPPATRWRVVVPCQSSDWPRVLGELQRVGAVGGRWKQVPLAPLSLAHLKPVANALPMLQYLFLQPKVGPLLTNLKLLDLIARQVDGGVEVETSSWVGEANVADWFWTSEIERGPEHLARGRSARALATRLADDFAASIAIDDLPASELAPLQTLVADQLCVQVPGNRIAFAHDLYGDWARLRMLRNQVDLPTFLQTRPYSPLWHRALRLQSAYLLESAEGVVEWRRMLNAFESAASAESRDVVLEAPVFAANARELLNALVADLLDDDGRLLRRLLNRFLAFATLADEETCAIAVSLGVEENEARASYRYPHWPLWLEVLAFLHDQRALIVPVAPCEIARVVEMWLAFSPPGAVGRPEASELAVLLGQRAINARQSFGQREAPSERTRYYKCALAAAHERPDEVVDIALRACERQGTGSATAVPSPQVRLFGGTQVPRRGIVLGPWPDGPHTKVDQALRDAVLEPGSVMHLYRVQPAKAREVILACLIQEPNDSAEGEHPLGRRDLSVNDREQWLPALYTRGPFLGCLKENFAEGLELIARLVDFATARELEEREANEDCGPTGQPVTLFDGKVSHRIAGNARVYGWSAGLGRPPYAIASALMALEQYFYERLDRTEQVDAEVAAVLARCGSVALLGVLSDVGKRQPQLFEGPLRSLLSAPELFLWESSKRANGRGHLLIGALEQGEWFAKLANRFHSQDHRKLDLRQLAVSLAFQNPSMREYFDSVRAVWQGTPSSGHLAEMKEQMSQALDVASYEVREDLMHGKVWVNPAALRSQEERADERKALEDHMEATAFPMECRAILDERRKLNDDVIRELWETWSRIRERAATHDQSTDSETPPVVSNYADAIAGGVAVFVSHPDWCDSELTRWRDLEHALRSVLDSPPTPRFFDGEDGVSTSTYDCFGAEAVAMLWARSPRNNEWRRRTSAAVLSRRYVAVAALFTRCAEARHILGDDFGRLRRLAIEWSHVRRRFELVRLVPREAIKLDDKEFESAVQEMRGWMEHRRDAFVAGTTAGVPNDWAECDDPSRFRVLDQALRLWAPHPSVDLKLIHSSHEWLPLPDDARTPHERDEVVRFWRAAVRVVVARPSREINDPRARHSPHDGERWVLERTGQAILQLRSDELPELLWEPVFALAGEWCR